MNAFIRHLLSSYRGYESLSPTLRVISSSHPRIPCGPIDLFDLLGVGCDSATGHKTLIQVDGKRAFLFWATNSHEVSDWKLEDGLVHAKQFFQRPNAPSTTFLYAIDHAIDDKKTGKVYMISILSLENEAAHSVYIPFQDRQALEETSRITGPGLKKNSRLNKKNTVVILALSILLLVAVGITSLLAFRDHLNKPELWLHWDHKRTVGLEQLQFTFPHPNFTSWAKETNHENEEWYVRLDDQSMIPARLVDEDEERYQQWFRNRYPVFEAVRASGDYLNETYYKHTLHAHALLQIDPQFHVTHCVLVMKRYWRAMESGRHVCPRDVDYKHINHCFEVVEQFAIEDFAPMTEDYGDDIRMPWIVNACF
jgi:hypothetical protein